jgi:hypothetical protein
LPLQHIQVFSQENTWCLSRKHPASKHFEAFQDTHTSKIRKALVLQGLEESEQLNSQEFTCK